MKIVEENEVTKRERVEIPGEKEALRVVQTTGEVSSGVQKTIHPEALELNGKPPQTNDFERAVVAFTALERAGTERLELSKLQPEIIRKLRERGMGKQAIIETLTPSQ